MIQADAPQGTARGDAGYKFADEFHPSLKAPKAGVLSMANAGPTPTAASFHHRRPDAASRQPNMPSSASSGRLRRGREDFQVPRKPRIAEQGIKINSVKIERKLSGRAHRPAAPRLFAAPSIPNPQRHIEIARRRRTVSASRNPVRSARQIRRQARRRGRALRR